MNIFIYCFLQQNARKVRLTLRNKRKLGQQFVEALHWKQLAEAVTTPDQSKQLSGKKARKKIRGGGAHEKGVPSLDAATAISLFSPGLKGAYVKQSGFCYEGQWKDVGLRKGSNILNHMVDTVYHVAKSFCPNDVAGLVQATLSHGSANSSSSKKQDYQQWSKTPLVQRMLQEYRSCVGECFYIA